MNPITLKREQSSLRDANVILEFKRDFSCDKEQIEILSVGEKNCAEIKAQTSTECGATLKIYSDFRFAAYINGEFVANAQFADCSSVKTYQEVNVSRFLKQGENQIRVIVFHYEGDHQVVRATEKAFCAFEICACGKIIAESDEKTLARVASRYKVGDIITPQLGYCFNYDFTAAEGAWGETERVFADFSEKKREIESCEIYPFAQSEIIAQGTFKYDGGVTSGEKMQRAYMRHISFNELSGGKKRLECTKLSGESETSGVTFSVDNLTNLSSELKPDGVFAIADLGREVCGYLSICVCVEKDCEAKLGWGEHLADLRPRTSVDGRNFALSLKLKKGENVLDDRLLRFGLRYLCLFVEEKSVIIKRLSVCETQYPFVSVKKDFGDELLNKIYETGRRTLYLCAHEHYEDCPWREQALYGMDSRNQMLFGYGAFEKDSYLPFARASLKLFAQTMRSDGLVELCPPSRVGFTIPSFTLYWIIGVCENAEADYNERFLKEILPTVKSAAEKFIARATDKGVKLFSDENYWNFHEWSDGLDGFDKKNEGGYDCILTALTVVALLRLGNLLEKFGEKDAADYYFSQSARLKNALCQFYNARNGFYCSYLAADGEKRGYHEYTQAVVLFAEACDKKVKERLIVALKNGDSSLVKMTYSAMLIKYQVIIAADKNADWCVKNVAELFGNALLGGATSFYETALGEADFDDAGSLCHGWSAVACYVLDEYAKFKC